MGRASGRTSAVATSAGRRAAPAATTAQDPAPAPAWEGGQTLAGVWAANQHVMAAGLAATMVAGLDTAGAATPLEAERRELWAMAGNFAHSVAPLLREAELVKAPALDACRVPQLGSNLRAAQFAETAKLPANPTFYDFRHPVGAGWVMTDSEPIEFVGALCWRDRGLLNVAPVWLPRNNDGSAKHDPDDALGGSPVMRCVFGREDAVVDELEPGALGANADNGELYCWPEMPQGGAHAELAHRTFRCSLRLMDVLVALNGKKPQRPTLSVSAKRDALAAGLRVPREHSAV